MMYYCITEYMYYRIQFELKRPSNSGHGIISLDVLQNTKTEVITK
ncbi:hypothetical protein FAM18168_02828 [Lacticaseibacillus paracasei]|nr:hypothetical protein FAM18110_02898 [Lacticaseibacillus paracasei]RND75270.1 hypothetical protein FAM18149_02987 [Lacticaseibacillus paracasei]RND80272.1 hypothetical protein FAM18168_02828 [Lacticaseibacillus paracasei]